MSTLSGWLLQYFQLCTVHSKSQELQLQSQSWLSPCDKIQYYFLWRFDFFFFFTSALTLLPPHIAFTLWLLSLGLSSIASSYFVHTHFNCTLITWIVREEMGRQKDLRSAVCRILSQLSISFSGWINKLHNQDSS